MEKSSQESGDEIKQVPQPIRGDLGATIMGPRNVPLEREMIAITLYCGRCRLR